MIEAGSLPSVVMGGFLNGVPPGDLKILRDRSFITSQGGAEVLEGGGYNFKTSTFLEGKFFSGKKHEGGQIL